MRNSTLLFCRDYGFHTFKVPIVSFRCSSRWGGGAICFRGLGVPHRKFHQPLHRVAQWLSHVHDEPHQGRMTFKKMVPCRSKSQTQPPGADDLPPSYSADAQQTNYRLNFGSFLAQTPPSQMQDACWCHNTCHEHS